MISKIQTRKLGEGGNGKRVLFSFSVLVSYLSLSPGFRLPKATEGRVQGLSDETEERTRTVEDKGRNKEGRYIGLPMNSRGNR